MHIPPWTAAGAARLSRVRYTHTQIERVTRASSRVCRDVHASEASQVGAHSAVRLHALPWQRVHGEVKIDCMALATHCMAGSGQDALLTLCLSAFP
jgi:hypothetical protein